MDFKSESFISNPNDLFDIPAAEQEITVGSSEQPVVHTNLASPNTVVDSSPSTGPIIIENPIGLGFHNPNPTPRPTRILMLHRAGQLPSSSVSNSVQRAPLKTVKIITVPGQGAGGRPLRAAVIPMHMLQRSMKFVSSSGASIVTSTQSASLSMPRVLTIRAPTQLASGGSIIGPPTFAPIRPGTLLLSSPANTAVSIATQLPTSYHSSCEAESNIFPGLTGADSMHTQQGRLFAPQASGYYDLVTDPPAPGVLSGYAQPTSPSGRESGDEQEHIPTGLKTNGLRRYARCVCDKVKEKGITSYSEVADELVHEYAAEHPMIPSEQLHYIQKNIRRRVYDALNVLMALNVLQKEKKEIRWVGLPVNMIEECRRLEEEREKCQVSLRNKTVEIQDLILQLIAFKNLVMRNRINERSRRSKFTTDGLMPENDGHTELAHLPGLEQPSSAVRTEKVPLPFLVISTHRKTVIDCNISTDKLEYLFNFDQAFEIRDEVDTLKRMGLMLRLGTIHCTQEEYNQCLELVPPSLRFYVEALYERRPAIVPDFDALHQQRRLFVEARLAAVANQAGNRVDEHGEPLGHRPGVHNSRHSPVDSSAHYGSLFGSAIRCSSSDNTLRQLYVSRSVDDPDDGHLISSSGTISSSGFVPGDTQHYARAAASRGYVVPGGPGGLLRHRQHPSAQVPSGSSGHPFVAGDRVVPSDTVNAGSSSGDIVCSVNCDSRQDISSTAGSGRLISHEDREDLADPEDDLMSHPDDDDDEDMEDV